MKKVLLFIIFLGLTGCYTPTEVYEIHHEGNRNTALVSTPTNGFGIGAGEKSVEHAIYAAFKTCIHYNKASDCTLKKLILETLVIQRQLNGKRSILKIIDI